VKVCEIFTSIQGESSYAGLPCTFIRITGCNLRCSYCDTQYAYENGREYSTDEIIGKVRMSGINLVEVTGGEPLLHMEVFALITQLCNEGFTVLIETNGSVSIRDVDSRAVIILDIKTPGSGMSEKMDFSNLDLIKQSDEVKFVITGRTDYEWSFDIMKGHGLFKKCGLLVAPAYGILHPAQLVKWMIEDRLDARLNLQIHKYIQGSPDYPIR
jgi:7-carboxy-7-deazaguanine synthase